MRTFSYLNEGKYNWHYARPPKYTHSYMCTKKAMNTSLFSSLSLQKCLFPVSKLYEFKIWEKIKRQIRRNQISLSYDFYIKHYC